MTPTVGSAVFFALIASAAGPTAGLADELVSSKVVVVVGEAALDLDKDGNTDRAVLVQNGASASVDLNIYFGTGGDTLAVARRPTILKKDIAEGAVVAIESGHSGRLTIRYGCGGCSDDSETELKLVYRGGQVLIGGFTLNWDTRSGIGSCDIDLLTRRGFVGHGVENRGRQIKVRSGPIALSAWSADKVAKICP